MKTIEKLIKNVHLCEVIMLQLDYKGEYERGVMTTSDFKNSFPSIDITDLSGESYTIRPMVYIWYKQPNADEEVITFLTDMEEGLPQGDIDTGNTACLRLPETLQANRKEIHGY